MNDLQVVEQAEPVVAPGPNERAGAVVVNPHLRLIRCSDDEIMVKHGTRSLFSEIISDSGRTKLLGKLLDRLRLPGTVEELVSEGVIADGEAEAAADAVAYLVERRVLTSAGRDVARAYVDTFLGDGDRLSTAVVGVAGGGSLGRRICRSLAELGPARLVVLDDGLRSNGARPIESELADGGFDRVETLVGDVTDVKSFVRLFDDVELAVVALDAYSPTALHAANEAAISTGTPWISTVFDGSEAIIGPTYVPGESPCFFEFDVQNEASLTLTHEAYLYKEHLTDGDALHADFVFPPHAEIASGFTGTSVVQFLLTGTAFTVGRAVRIDFERASVDTQDVLRLPRCPACSALRPPYRHLFL